MTAQVALDLRDALSQHLAAACLEQREIANALQRFREDIEAIPAQLDYSPDAYPSVRGLAYIAAAAAQAHDRVDGRLVGAARSAIGWAKWSEYYAQDAWSAPFLDKFANGDIVGPDATWKFDRLILGLFAFGPDMHYPAHAHAAEEVYVVLSGRPEFAVGDGTPFVARNPGDVVVHPTSTPHAIRTGTAPVFGVYAWRGAIAEPAWYCDPANRRHQPVILR